MYVLPDHIPEFLDICQKILSINASLEQWLFMPSPSPVKTEHFHGGLDSLEEAFYFIYTPGDGKEYWVQKDLEEMKALVKSNIKKIKIRITPT